MSDTRIDYLLVGGGRTSANAAQAIREGDATGTITIVTAEDRKPYDRPPLSKNFIEGRPPEPEDVESKADDFFEKHSVDLIRGVEVTSIDRAAKTATLADGRILEYGKLLLATGASPIKLNVPGGDRDNVHYLRTVDQSMAIRDAAKTSKRAVLVGSGYIGTEVSAVLSGLGVHCTMVGLEGRPWERFASQATGDWLKGYFEGKGVTVKMNSQVTEILDNGVKLATGEMIEGDLIVVGIGARLNLGLAKDAGLEVDEKLGVRTDSNLRTSDPNIWAAGDIAAYQDVNFGKTWHLEHYMNATWQGTQVGKNMTGANEPYAKVPYFYSDMFDIHFLLRGDPTGGPVVKLLGDRDIAEFTELYGYADGRLAMGIVVTRDADKQDVIGDKIEQYILERKQVSELDSGSF